MKYAILIKPIGNIPFFETMKTMCIYEFMVMSKKLGMMTSNIESKSIGKGTYLFFESEDVLSDEHLKHMTQLSFFYTMFIVDKNQWSPIDSQIETFIGEDISVRLKYNGKTNESFTRLMLNLAIYSSSFCDVDYQYNLLDPVCGKGTTLFEGLIKGFNVYGVDKSKTSLTEMNNYLLRYLKEGRYKHQAMSGKSVIDGKNIGDMFQVYLGKTKEEVKKKTGQSVKVLCGDTNKAEKFIKKQSIHYIVGDLPYGVQHMGKEGSQSVRTLNDLLKTAVKSWYQVLKKGGSIALSWNTFTDDREQIKKVLEENGFVVFEDEEYHHFYHRVSQAINRDVIVAIKK